LITKNIYVKDIEAGNKVNDIFLVTEKNLAVSQKGSPYLNLRLRDKTGEVEGRVWENAAALNRLFQKGDVIEIRSRATNYRNVTQLSISQIAKVEDSHINPADYSPASKSDIDKMFEDLMKFVEEIKTPPMRSKELRQPRGFIIVISGGFWNIPFRLRDFLILPQIITGK